MAISSSWMLLQPKVGRDDVKGATSRLAASRSGASSRATPVTLCGRWLGERRRVVWAICFVVFGYLSIPVLLNTHPPLVDYPFHIGRIAILAAWQDSPFVREHYEISSFLLPNLSIDLVVLPLAHLVSIPLAADIFLLVSLLLILTGTVRLHQVLFGSTSYWPLLASLFLYNWILLFGFLNYYFSIGMLLWCLVGWVRLADRPAWARLLCGSFLALLLFFGHLVAFGLYAVAVGGFELQRAISGWLRSGRLELSGLLTGAAPFLFPVMVFLASPTRAVADAKIDYRLFEKAGSVIVTLTAGSPALDLVTAAAMAIGASLVLAFGRVQLAGSFLLPLAALLVTFLALPHSMEPGALIDVRVPAAGLFILIAASRVSFRRVAAARAFVAVASVYLLVKVAGLSVEWLEFDRIGRQYTASFDRLAPQSTLFFARQTLPHSWAQRMYVDRVQTPPHAASLAALRGDLFVPSLFAEPGAQPIRLRSRFADIQAYQGFAAVDVGSREQLDAAVRTFSGLQRRASPARRAYLLLLDRATPPLPPPADGHLVAAGDGFRLFEIYRPPRLA